jgi:predicted TIM-barrel fold metal-dependent hydrolase
MGDATAARDRPAPAGPVIDIQTHYVPPAAARIVKRYCDGQGARIDGLALGDDPAGPMFDVATRLRAMDAAGIDVSVLSFAPIGIIEHADVRVDLCRAANDGLLDLCAAHPGRFVAAASLPLPDGPATLDELNRIRDQGDLRAIHIVAQTTLYRPDAIEMEPVFRAAADAGLPVIIHPSAGVADLAPQFADYGLASGMHAMVSSALVAARMIQSGMLDRIPGLELIVTHLGGILPFLIDRLDSRNSGPTAFPPSHYLRTRLWFDACGYPAGPALRCALETVGRTGPPGPSRPLWPRSARSASRPMMSTPFSMARHRAGSIRGGLEMRQFDRTRTSTGARGPTGRGPASELRRRALWQPYRSHS